MIVELEKASVKRWNAALSEAEPKGTIFQSTFWAEFLNKTFGDRPIFLASFNKRGNK